MKPDPEWLPMAWLLPACLVLWAVAVIEGAAEAWADESDLPDAESDCGCGVRGCVWGHGA